MHWLAASLQRGLAELCPRRTVRGASCLRRCTIVGYTKKKTCIVPLSGSTVSTPHRGSLVLSHKELLSPKSQNALLPQCDASNATSVVTNFGVFGLKGPHIHENDCTIEPDSTHSLTVPII